MNPKLIDPMSCIDKKMPKIVKKTEPLVFEIQTCTVLQVRKTPITFITLEIIVPNRFAGGGFAKY